MFAFKRFSSCSRAMVGALLLCLGWGSVLHAVDIKLVDSGPVSAKIGEVQLPHFTSSVTQVFKLENKVTVNKIEVLAKPITGDEALNTILFKLPDGYDHESVAKNTFNFSEGGGPIEGGYGSTDELEDNFSYQSVGMEEPVTLEPGYYGLQFYTSGNSSGLTIILGTTSTQMLHPGYMVLDSDVGDIWYAFTEDFTFPNVDAHMVGIRIWGKIESSKFSVDKGVIDMGNVPINTPGNKTLTFKVSASDLALWTQLPTEDGSAVDGPFSLPPTPFSSNTIAAQTEIPVTINFTPTEEGSFLSYLWVLGNDPSLPENTAELGQATWLKIPIVGKGFVPGEPLIFTQYPPHSITVNLGSDAFKRNVEIESQETPYSYTAYFVADDPTVNFLTVDISNGQVQPNNVPPIIYTVHPENLEVGDYTGKLKFIAKDLTGIRPEGRWEIDVTLHVVEDASLVVPLVLSPKLSIFLESVDPSHAQELLNSLALEVSCVGLPGPILIHRNASGEFDFSPLENAPCQTLTVEPQMNRDFQINAQKVVTNSINEPSAFVPMPDDVEYAVGTANDAVFLLNYVAKAGVTLTPLQEELADLNDDGFVDLTDVLVMLNFLAFKPKESTLLAGTWIFDPPQFEYTIGSSLPELDFYMMGDLVHDNNVATKVVANSGQASIDIQAAEWTGTEVVLPVRVSNGGAVNSLLLSMDYDATQLQYVSTQLTEAGKSYLMADNGAQSGKVHLAMVGQIKSAISDPLFEMRFKLIGDVKTTQRVDFLLSRLVINDLKMPVGPSSVLSLTQTPSEFLLAQNHPNPFNPDTQIQFALPKADRVRLTIFNALGQVVRVLVDQEFVAGNHQVIWDGRTESGALAATGIYIYRIQTESGFSAIKRMLLLK